MSIATSLRDIAHQLDNSASLGRVVDDLLAARSEPPAMLALGEPTHGIEEFPLLRNEILRHLVERGYRSIALETDVFAAALVDDYVAGEPAEIDTVLTSGFSHGFGAVPGNRELVEWLREHNAGLAPQDRVRFYGFDAPVEFSGAPSPRVSLSAVIDYLPASVRPESVRDLDALVGSDDDWSNEDAMYDPSASIGNSDDARTLRILADDLASALRRAAPNLRLADPVGYDNAASHARTARGLLRYHAAMARSAPDRIGNLLSLRAEMMADNLLAIAEVERPRGPSLVFAHNAHLQRAQSTTSSESGDATWCSAGALAELTLGERHMFIATDAAPDSAPGTLQNALAAATDRRALFPAPALRAALPPSIDSGEPIAPGHIPITLADMNGADAVIFVADTDGKQHRYW